MSKQILNSSALTAHSLPNEGTRVYVRLCGDWSGEGICVGEKAQGIFWARENYEMANFMQAKGGLCTDEKTDND